MDSIDPDLMTAFDQPQSREQETATTTTTHNRRSLNAARADSATKSTSECRENTQEDGVGPETRRAARKRATKNKESATAVMNTLGSDSNNKSTRKGQKSTTKKSKTKTGCRYPHDYGEEGATEVRGVFKPPFITWTLLHWN
eukprot:gb/GECG01015419.1/.p1 GENE.gb/GECG01015419.1/~~gb/GECG01015419.1/.p1  ORF type:complete len:142 (+),score=16.85 gb/GECG01015419.1/:1-426(+)